MENASSTVTLLLCSSFSFIIINIICTFKINVLFWDNGQTGLIICLNNYMRTKPPIFVCLQAIVNPLYNFKLHFSLDKSFPEISQIDVLKSTLKCSNTCKICNVGLWVIGA